MFEISHELPPKEIYNRAVEMFGADFNRGTTFTVGNTIYCKGNISPDLLEHEKVHIKQQGSNWKEWWEKYFTNEKFRLDQELDAYKTQYRWIKTNIKDRNLQSKYLMFFSSCLSGKMYGDILSMTDAIKLIKN